MINRFTYANGLNISQARRICKFYFGDFFHKAEMNNDHLIFDIFIWKQLNTSDGIIKAEEQFDLTYFNEFWNKTPENPAWKISLIEREKRK